MSKPRDFTRQLDIFVPDKDTNITIIGAGGIGSWTCQGLVKTGFKNITVYDGDVVEPHNLPNQLFEEKHLGVFKAYALQDMFPQVVTAVPYYYKDEDIDSSIILLAVDKMDIRKHVVKTKKASLILDARIGGEFIRVLSVSLAVPSSKKYYLDTWYPDEEAKEVPCTARAILDVAFAVAALNIRLIRLFLTRGLIYREVLFNVETLDILKIGEAT